MMLSLFMVCSVYTGINLSGVTLDNKQTYNAKSSNTIGSLEKFRFYKGSFATFLVFSWSLTFTHKFMVKNRTYRTAGPATQFSYIFGKFSPFLKAKSWWNLRPEFEYIFLHQIVHWGYSGKVGPCIRVKNPFGKGIYGKSLFSLYKYHFLPCFWATWPFC